MSRPLQTTARTFGARIWATLLLGFLEAVAISSIWLLCLPKPAYAYVDPSVMTYTIQALAGVAVALSAVAGVVFRRIRRKVFKTLNIDENANKAVEGPIARIANTGPNAPEEHLEADERAVKLREQSAVDSEKRFVSNLTWPKRLAFSILMCVFVFFIVLVAPALEILAGNTDSLVFGLDNVWWITAGINGAFAIVCAFALSALKEKAFMRAMLFVFCIAFAAYIQSFFMNGGMFPADGGFLNWTDWHFVSRMIFSGIVWLLILVLPQILCRSHRGMWLKVTSGVAAAIIIMQGVGVASVAIESGQSTMDMKMRPYVTQGNLYEVGQKHNVIVFVLDTYDTKLMEELREEDPHLLDEFTDFTYFRNSAGAMVPTQNAVPYLLSGVQPDHGEDLDEYRASRYERSRFIPAIYDSGYSIDIYTDTAMFDYSKNADGHIAEISGNIHQMQHLPIDVWKTYLALDQCALYREAPWVLKPLFWYYTTEVNNRMIGSASGDDGHDELYELDDANILVTLREQGLSMSDVGEEGSEGAFKFIHLYGPHFPFNIDENGEFIGVDKSTQERQAKGSLKVVDEYFRELKKLGVYDSATIIVTADHGIWDEREDPIQHPTSPIMLVKPSMPDGGTGAPCVISDVPVSHMDFAPTIIAAIGQDPSSFGSGLTVWDIVDGERPRFYDALTRYGDEDRRFIEYEIDGDIVDLESWHKTGEEWPGA